MTMNTRPSGEASRLAVEALLGTLSEALGSAAAQGRKWQPIFVEFIREIDDVLDRGYTYRYLAKRLTDAGVVGPREAVLTQQSLFNYVKRARKAAAKAIGSTGVPAGALRKSPDDDRRPILSSFQRSVPSTGEVPRRLADFVSKIGEATAHEAVTDQILGRHKPRRS
jgi:hypothetical protein